mmetsp:Transcript_112010/g.327564  ORF Transcript_112010/g.327564 Transcript_112010/m.327564 type:complete len:211 (-) Transcript_112010:499-1131(-)
MSLPQYDKLFKLLLIGDSYVGKSSLLIRFTDDDFKEVFQSTIGVDFKVCMRTVDGKNVRMTIWDTAGQERFNSLHQSYYHGAHGVVLVYDITDRQSFEHVRGWMKEVNERAGGISRLLVGSKCDLAQRREVSEDEGRQLAEELGVLFTEASARDSSNVELAFSLLVSDISERLSREPQWLPAGPLPLTHSSVSLASESRARACTRGNCCK